MFKVTNTGPFEIGDAILTCHVVEGGMRVLPWAGILRMLEADPGSTVQDLLTTRQIALVGVKRIRRFEIVYSRIDGERETGLSFEGLAMLIATLAGGMERDDLEDREHAFAKRCLQLHLGFVLAGMEATRIHGTGAGATSAAFARGPDGRH